MEAEIHRILDLLTEGKIDAAEAERLILALRQERATQASGARSAERPVPEPLARLDREARAAARRLALWCRRVALTARCREQAQRRERARRTIDERVRHVLVEHLLVEQSAVVPEAALAHLVADISGNVRGARLGWEVLRLGLEDEFGEEWTQAQVEAIGTVADLVAEVTRRTDRSGPSPSPGESATPGPAGEDAQEPPSEPVPGPEPTPDTVDGEAK